MSRRRSLFRNIGGTDVLTQNLVASYQFENEVDMNTSTHLFDSFGGNHGIVESEFAPTIRTGVVNNCWEISANTQVKVKDEFLQNFALNDGVENKSIAFSFWVYFYGDTVGDKFFFAKRGGLGGSEYQLSYFSGNLGFTVWNTDGSTTSVRANDKNFTTNQWYHLSGYMDLNSETGELFEDNINITNEVVWDVKEFLSSGAKMSIGYAGFTDDFQVNGRLDELRFWIGDTVPNDFSKEWNNGNGITI